VAQPAEAARAGRPAPGRCAYAAVLWGAAPGYILGAMVLARSLRTAARTRHDLVLLHTDSVPAAALRLLSRAGWRPREVEEVQGVSELYNHGEPRFQGVFTKLRVFELLEYEKVICMDIDTLAIGSMDELFDLRAPAANARGPQDVYLHGDPIDGASFFVGSTQTRKSWGQCWGINAGVMLLKPSEADLQQTLLEATDSRHPSHIRGNGPEQDYLSRYFAGSWTHIGVEYNFQLHQMYHVLHPRDFQDPRLQLMQQFLDDPSHPGIHLVHYSGSLKPWSQVLDEDWRSDMSEEADEGFVRATLESFNGYWLWALKDPLTVEYQGFKEGVALGPDGKLHWIDWDSSSTRTSSDKDVLPQQPLLRGEVDIPEQRVRAAERLVARSLVWWRQAYGALQEELGLADLAAEVAVACVGPAAAGAGEGGALSTPAKEEQSGWRCHDGWWADWPVQERASAVAGCVPEPFVAFSVCGRTLLDVRGAAAAGAHLRAVLPGGTSAEAPTGNGDIADWASRLPAGALVLAAFVGQAGSNVAAQALQGLAAVGFGGTPPAAAPPDCGVSVLAAARNEAGPCQTMAAADFALASLPCCVPPGWEATRGAEGASPPG